MFVVHHMRTLLTITEMMQMMVICTEVQQLYHSLKRV